MNPEIKTILYATDMGDHMRPVFRNALEIARKHEAKIIMLHVMEPLNSGILMAINVYMPKVKTKKVLEEGMKTALAKMQKRLEKFCKDEKESHPDECTFISKVKVVSGRSAETIIHQADKLGVDLIVVGSHTDPTIRSSLLGSTARNVTQLSRRPVLVVPVYE